jgi:hypothetical protein
MKHQFTHCESGELHVLKLVAEGSSDPHSHPFRLSEHRVCERCGRHIYGNPRPIRDAKNV